MRERLERRAAQLGAQRGLTGTPSPAPVSAPAEDSSHLATRIESLRAELDTQYQPLMEQLVALNSRLERMDLLLNALDQRMNPGLSVLDRRIGGLWQQVNIVIGVTLLMTIIITALVLARG